MEQSKIVYFALPEERVPVELEEPVSLPLWIHLRGEDRSLFDAVARFSLHQLSIDDCFSRLQLPKVETYDAYTFIVLHGTLVDESKRASNRDRLPLREIRFHAFISDSFLITHAPEDSPADRLIIELRQQRYPTPLSTGDILYKLLDRLVDDTIPLLDVWEDATAKLEEELLGGVSRKTLDAVFEFRRHLRRVAKLTVLEREVFYRLSHDDIPGISKDVRIFLRDSYDHIVRLVEYTTTHREAISDALEVNLALTSNRTNGISKQLTVAATLLLPLNVIAGIFGMNFHDMPLLSEPWGFWAALGSMVTIVVALLVYFNRNNWLRE